MMRILRIGLAACVLAASSAGCDWDPLEVQDPTAIGEADLDGAEGAELFRVGAMSRLNFAFQGFFGFPVVAAIFSDEFFADTDLAYYQSISSVSSRELIDRREHDVTNTSAIRFHDARHSATKAIELLRAFDGPEAYVGQMFGIRGLAKLYLTDNLCPGQAFNEFEDDQFVFTPPLTTVEAYENALEDLDSAVVHAADSARILFFAQVARARAFLELGRFAEAAAGVASVPTSFRMDAEFGGFLAHELVGITSSTRDPLSVADRKGGNGVDFVSAQDPRVPTSFSKKAWDGVTDLYELDKYASNQAPIPLASGIEARLIEAEAALAMGDGAWLTILNDLRATAITPSLDALGDPGDPETRLDLVFRERAFWLFATGRRLGDLRRLVRLYGRDVEETFPWGQYRMGGIYGPATAFAMPESEKLNPAVTGCTDR